MRYRLTASWNGTQALDARCTAVVAYEIIQNGYRQFAAPKAQGSLGQITDILEMKPGTSISGVIGDKTPRDPRGTGEFRWVLTHLPANVVSLDATG